MSNQENRASLMLHINIDGCNKNGNPPPVWSQQAGSVFLSFRPAAFPETERVSEYVTGEVTGVVTGEVTGEVHILLVAMKGEMKRQEIQAEQGLKHEDHFRKAYLVPALKNGLIEMTIPEKPRSSKQKYRLTNKGRYIRTHSLKR